MAQHEPIIPPAIAERLKNLVNRGPNSKGMDGNRSDSNNRGATPQASQEQGSNLDNRGNGGSRVRETQAASPTGDRVLLQPSTSLPEGEASIHKALEPEQVNNPFLTGDHILKAIMDKFVELRENQKVGAWKQLQSDLMRAAPFIVPHIIPLKDVIQIAADIEKEIKGSTAQVGRSNEELLADFLTGGDAIQLSEKALDKGVIVQPRNEESMAVPNASGAV